MMFGYQSSILHTSVDIHIDIETEISMQGLSTIDIRGTLISMDEYQFLWISVLNCP